MGSEKFMDRFRGCLTGLSEKLNIKRECSQGNHLISWLEINRLIQMVASYYKTDRQEICRRYFKGGNARQTTMYLAHRYCRGRYSLSELSDHFNVSVSGFSSAFTKFTIRLKKEKDLELELQEIEKQLMSIPES